MEGMKLVDMQVRFTPTAVRLLEYATDCDGLSRAQFSLWLAYVHYPPAPILDKPRIAIGHWIFFLIFFFNSYCMRP